MRKPENRKQPPSNQCWTNSLDHAVVNVPEFLIGQLARF
jgi:hypothetical protein